MKKFLSLVLALIMTMSLVTISAGATEYKDLTDKDEIKYEEAVAVLNRIGIITGYDDGSFQPTKELTRGAAAKIIVSLLIGPEAASALPNNTAPYPDVPAGSTFAGVISFCKTREIISGYGDGTFKPTNSLTGYAFSKMLLGAVGYDSKVEGFTGTGWTMNVASIGNYANLFNRIEFDGSAAVNREQACQLALNTLKATMVEYNGGVNINTASGDTMTVNPTRTYKISNQEYAKNISNRKASDKGNVTGDTHWTVEFGEEHFKDLRLDNEHQGKLDDFGRPSNVWSYKKVTIGTFPVEPDFTYTTQVAAKDDPKISDATKLRALGLNGFEVDSKTELRVNGLSEFPFNAKDNNVYDIANYTDNGTLVEVYVSDDDADYICNVAVIQTQLMEVKKIGSDYVSLNKEDDCDDKKAGFNREPIQEVVDDVEVEDVCYDFLKDLKAEDKVAVVPLTTDGGKTYTVAKAYAPETVTGTLDGSKTFAVTGVEDKDRSVVQVTVGGTDYKVANWNKDLNDANRDIIKVTKNDVTLLLDEYGNAMLAKDIGSTTEVMVLGAWRNAVVNGVLVRLATGWDMKGNAVSLNVGAEQSAVVKAMDYEPGDVLRYTNDGVTGIAEWSLNENGIYRAPGNDKTDGDLAIKASNSAVKLGDTAKPYPAGLDDVVMKASGVKTVYVAFDGDEVDYIEIKSGLQNATKKELDQFNPGNTNAAQGVVKLDSGAVTAKSEVEYVVIKQESSDATLKNLGYVYDVDTTNKRDENGDIISDYKVFTNEDEAVRMLSAKNIGNQRFVRFNELNAETKLYDMRTYDRRQTGTSVMRATILGIAAQKNNTLLSLDPDSYASMANEALNDANTDPDLKYPNIQKNIKGFGTDLTVGDKVANLISIKGAKFLDLTNNKISDADDLEAILKGDKDKGIAPRDVKVHIAFNDNPDNDEFRLAYIVVVVDVIKDKGAVGAVDSSIPGQLTDAPATVEVGKSYTVTIASGYSYKAADNQSVTVTKVDGQKVTFTVDALSPTPTIGVSKDTETKTLTIKEPLASATDLYVFADEDILTGTEKVTAADGKVMEYKVPVDAKVTMRSASIDVNPATYVMKDDAKTKVTVTTAGVAEIAAMTADAVVSGLKKASDGSTTVDRTYTITVEDGMELSAFENTSGPVDWDDAVESVSDDGRVYTMKASANITKFKVKIDSAKNDATFAFVSDDSNPVNNYNIHNGGATTQAALATATTCKDTAVEVATPIPNGNVHVLGGHKVQFTNINPACFGFFPNTKNASGTITSIIQRGYGIPVSISIGDDDASAAIWLADGATATAAQDRVHNGFKIEADGALVGAVKVSLVDVTATINGTAGTTGTWYVKTGTDIKTPTVETGKGSTVIDASKGETFGAKVTSDQTVIGKDYVFKAATEITGAANIRIEAYNPVTELDGEILNGTGTIAVVPGTTVNIYGTSGQTLAVKKTTGGDVVTDGVNISGNTGTFKVGTVDVTLSQA